MVRVTIFSLYPTKATRVKLEYLSLSKHYDVQIVYPEVPDYIPGKLKTIFRYILFFFQVLFTKTDVIHYSNIPDFQALAILFRPRVKFVYDVRSIFSSNMYHYSKSYFVYRLIYKIETILTRNADLVITANKFMSRRARNLGANQVITVPNYPLPMLKVSRTNDEIRQELNSLNKVVFLIVTKLTAQKPIEEMMKQLDKIQSDRQIILWVIGDGSDRKRLEKTANRLGLEVKFIGYIPLKNLGDYISAADFCLAVYHDINERIPQFYTVESVWKVGEYALFDKPIIAVNMVDSPGLINISMKDLAKGISELLENEHYPLLEKKTWRHSHIRLIRGYENFIIER